MTGVGEITRWCATVNGQERWYFDNNTSYMRAYASPSDLGIPRAVNSDNSVIYNICSKGTNTTIFNGFAGSTGNFLFYIPASMGITTKQDWLDFIADNPLQICYTLATPQTFTFTSINMKSLRGKNNIWSNTNSTTEVKYWTHGSIADKRTIVWNQIAQDGDFSDGTNKWQVTGATSTLTVNNHVARAFHNAVTSQYIGLQQIANYQTSSISGHKYLFLATVQTISGRLAIVPTGSSSDGMSSYNTYTSKTIVKWIWNCSVTKNILLEFRIYTGSGVTSELECTFENVMLIDLTQMFGTGNEPSTAAEFEALCAKNGIDLSQPQPYDEGT